VVVLDAVMVVEMIDHDAEGYLDAAWRDVAEPIDPPDMMSLLRSMLFLKREVGGHH
jgi:hypothetical protein